MENTWLTGGKTNSVNQFDRPVSVGSLFIRQIVPPYIGEDWPMCKDICGQLSQSDQGRRPLTETLVSS